MNNEDWKDQLSPEAYRVCRQGGTEPPFSSPLNEQDPEGTYHCVCCGQALFSSEAKFHSGSGWPSFTAPVQPEAITEHGDQSLGMARTEVRCAGCDAHLGHVFPDGPAPTGLRYCINGVCLQVET